MVAGVNDMLNCAHRVPRVTRLYHDTPKKCMPVWDVIDNNYIIIIITTGFAIVSTTYVS